MEKIIEKDLIEVPTEENPIKVALKDAVSQNNVIYYNIKAKGIQLPFKKDEAISIERTHEDFKKLLEKLEEADDIFGFIIPPLPRNAEIAYVMFLTDQQNNTNNDKFIESIDKLIEEEYDTIFKKCIRSHELFLLKIVEKACFYRNSSLLDFLTKKSFAPSKEGFISSFLNLTSSLFKSLEKSSFEYMDKDIQGSEKFSDEYIEKNAVFIKSYVRNTTQIYSQLTEIVKYQKRIAFHCLHASICYQDLVSVEHSKISDLFPVISQFLKNEKEFYLKSANCLDDRLNQTFKYIHDLLNSSSQLYLQRGKLLQQYVSQHKDLEKSKLVNSPDISVNQFKYDEICGKLENFCLNMRQSLEEVLTDRVSFLTKNIKNYCEIQLKLSTNRINKIEKTIKMIQAQQID